MIHVLHGLFGAPSDFAFLEGKDVVLHDLYDPKFHIDLKSDDILIGYSMGGRVALELADKVNFKIKKLILLNSHPGLSTQEEKNKRKSWENEILSNLNSLKPSQFFDYWNSLPIFEHDQPLLPISEERYEASKLLFDKFRLSNQPNFLDSVSKHLDIVLWIVGLQDEKYMSIAEEKLLPLDIAVKGIPGGHRLFQRPLELVSALKEEGIL